MLRLFPGLWAVVGQLLLGPSEQRSHNAVGPGVCVIRSYQERGPDVMSGPKRDRCCREGHGVMQGEKEV